MTKLFIGGFPLEITEMELVQMISPFAEVSTIKIVRDKITRKCKGYAFVEVLSREAAKNAAESLDGAVIVDRQLTVRLKEDEPPRPVPVYKKVERAAVQAKKKRPRIK